MVTASGGACNEGEGEGGRRLLSINDAPVEGCLEKFRGKEGTSALYTSSPLRFTNFVRAYSVRSAMLQSESEYAKCLF